MPSLPMEVLEDLDSPDHPRRAPAGNWHHKPGKAPGPDGYTVQYYKTLLPIIGPRMVTFFNSVGTGTTLPR